MLIGAELFPQILLPGKLTGSVNEPIAINTIFGWILMGKYQESSPSNHVVTSLFCNTEIEQIPTCAVLSPDDALCESIYTNFHKRDKAGRYEVKLPFRDNHDPNFDDKKSFLSSARRFYALEKRLLCNKDVYLKYSNTIKEYLDAGVLVPVSSNDVHEWHFNLPSAPHFSGLAEAGVKSVKTHLSLVIGMQVLRFEQLYTVLVQIESLLNSRPLCPLSDDPNDLSVLTPAHFLNLEPVSALPDDDLSNINVNHGTAKYLHTLQQRTKWLKPTSPAPVIGQIVLVKDDNLPPLQWSIARILELHPDQNNVARIATIFSKGGTYKRPLVKLCPLPTLD
nr:unnamed protein product [Callosobruchus analis]